MKRFLFIALMIFFSHFAHGENDVLKRKDTLSAGDFNRLINNQFSYLITGQAVNTIGGFASFDPGNPKVNFAPNYIFSNGNIIALKASGGISDGIFEIFNHSELNTNLSLDVQFNFINRLQGRSLEYDVADYKAFSDKRIKIMETFSSDSLYLVKYQEYNMLKLERAKLSKRLLILDKSRIELEKQAGENVEIRLDSLDYERASLDMKLKFMDNRLKEMSTGKWMLESKIRLRNSQIDQLNEVGITTLPVEGFRMGWFSVGYKLSNDAFKTFNPSLEFSNQVQKEKVISHEFRAQYSFYHWSAWTFKTFFVSAALTYHYKSNYEDLSTIELTEITEYGLRAGDRTSTKKYSAYTGDLKKSQNEWVGSFDLYYFMLKNNSVGIHLFPAFRFTENQNPITNLTLGFIIPFKNQKDEKSMVNTEIYYCFTDVFKTTETTFKLFERNKIGLRFAFPINFNLNK